MATTSSARVAQAKAAEELFWDQTLPESEIERIDLLLKKQTQNIVLVGTLAPGPDAKLYLSPTFVETEADFMRLMTEQLRHQDPLKPLESFEAYAAKQRELLARVPRRHGEQRVRAPLEVRLREGGQLRVRQLRRGGGGPWTAHITAGLPRPECGDAGEGA